MTVMQCKDECQYLFAVFDGHRGSDVAQHAAIYFPHMLKHQLQQQPKVGAITPPHHVMATTSFVHTLSLPLPLPPPRNPTGP
jgi:hypothetical protein